MQIYISSHNGNLYDHNFFVSSDFLTFSSYKFNYHGICTLLRIQNLKIFACGRLVACYGFQVDHDIDCVYKLISVVVFVFYCSIELDLFQL